MMKDSHVGSLEHPTLKVPYEILNKKYRTAQKTVDREISHVQAAVGQIEDFIKSTSGDKSGLPSLLGSLDDRLGQLKEKSKEAVTDEIAAAEACKRRVDHLRMGCAPPTPAVDAQWRKTRVDRMLVEYFLRMGHYDTAVMFAKSCDVEDLTNINLFLVAKEVEEALSKKDIQKCLTWCHDNKSKLRKMRSNLEFNLRIQELIELIMAGNKMEAVRHARKYLTTEDPDPLFYVRRAMGLLAFPKTTRITRYKELMSQERWQNLIKEFRNENYRLYQLSNQSVFTVAMQTGLSSLKTTQCYRHQGDRNNECPVCQTPLNDLAAPLPFAHCSQSKLFCFITKEPMNENNTPMMLPNGFVYGEHALAQMAAENDGQVLCPRTKEIYLFSDVQKVYTL